MSDELSLQTFTAPQRPLEPHLPFDAPEGGWTFPPTSVTLLAGEREAILIDTVPTLVDSKALADWVESTGKTLTTVFITHCHFDHYLGVATLLDRFPVTRVVATQATVRHIANERLSGAELSLYSAMFVDTLPSTVVVPEILGGDRLDLEGHDVVVVATGQSDHVDSSYVHLPELKAVIVGDIAYNDVHCALVNTDHEKRQEWISTLKEVQALRPEIVIAAHRRADAPDDSRALTDTIGYIEQADRLLNENPSAADFTKQMLTSHPTRLNASTVLFSAASLGLT
ncbi:hypothetical protein B1R94_28685 [Mycolicibacterium litorale]|nr:hypothetical protein B1R94_28685 [Mycolicibacterium litorale]